MAGIGLLAVVVAGIAFVRYRDRETEQLRRGASLAAELRALADGDAVRLAAVEEYETSLYQRLFYVSTVSPRVRSAVWSLLAAVLSAGGALVTRGDGLTLAIVHWTTLFLAVVFALAALFFAGLAAFHAATTPRVSFAESYTNDDTAGSGGAGSDTAGSGAADTIDPPADTDASADEDTSATAKAATEKATTDEAVPTP
ncbi:histidine kinase [Gordonia oryzae]|uniref:Histidine kinase n=1 Tax=Gordonia oryzae TaxID=2487349 RepID=A0A3N4GA82_9ACTN|nr:histidine kinase [Gordonia oryzae]RPA57476.1 histidine kinase [Gordonia oryzae]